MQLSTKFDMAAVDYSKDNVLNLRVSLEAPPLPDDFERNPAFIVAVLDQSGSMTGEKFSILQSTMYRLVENLTDQDELAMVWFNSDATSTEIISMDKEGKKKAKEIIKAEIAGGGTNIPVALGAAKALLGDRARGGDTVEKILLMTDGQTSLPEQCMPFLSEFRQEIGLSCFGYGADYNESLLEEMSGARNGACYFIEDTDMLAEAFGEELGGLLSRYASGITVSLSMSDDGEIVKVLNDYPVGQEDSGGKTTYKVQVGDAMYGETKEVFVRLKVNAHNSPVVIDLASVRASFSSGNAVEIQEQSVSINLVEASEVGLPDQEIAEQVLLLDAAQVQLEAKDKADNGEWQEAKKIFDSMIEKLEAYGTDRACNYANVMKNQSDGLNSSYARGGIMAKAMSSGAYTAMRRRGSAGVLTADYAVMRLGSARNAFADEMVANFTSDDEDDS